MPSGFRGLAPTTDLARLIPPDPPSTPLPAAASHDPTTLPVETAPDILPEVPGSNTPAYRTEPNAFGLYREYLTKPRYDPADLETPHLLVDSPTIAVPFQPDEFSSRNPLCVIGKKTAAAIDTAANWFAPFLNPSVFRLLRWSYDGSTEKSSINEMDKLVNNVIKADDFDPSHFDDFSCQRELNRLDEYKELSGIFSAEDGWREGSVKFNLPKENVAHENESEAPEFEVTGLWYRPLREVIKSAYEDVTQRYFHVQPFKLFHHQSPSSTSPENAEADERVWTDIYNSDAMLEEQAKINALPRNTDDTADIEYAIAAVMMWSDAMRLANFGTQSLWPFYAFFGSLSKYLRGKPSTFAAHHLAYIPSVSF